MKRLKTVFGLKTILPGVLLLVLIAFAISGKLNVAREMENLFLDLYHNRLIAEDHVYRLSSHFHQKKIDLITLGPGANQTRIPLQHDSVLSLIAGFSKTSLTREEGDIFKSLEQNVRRAQQLEVLSPGRTGELSDLKQSYDKVLSDLDALSNIQVKEAGALLYKAKKSSASFLLSSELFWALGFIALLILAGTLSPKQLRPKPGPPPLLN